MRRAFQVIGVILLLAGLFSLSIPTAAVAAYPDKPVLIIVPYSPGGGVDILFRLVSKYIPDKLGQNLVVENKPGAGGQVGWTTVAKARPDGYTIGATSQPSMILVKSLRGKEVPFELSDFQYVCNLQSDPIVWVVHKDSPFQTARDVIEYAKANPDKLNIAGDGPQSNVQLQQLMVDNILDIKTNFVSYSGSNPAVTAALGNKVDLTASSLGAALTHIESGALRALAVFNDERMKIFPDLPTATEALGVEIPSSATAMRGVIAPKDMKKEDLDTLEKAFKSLAEDPEFVKAAEDTGIFIQFIGSDDFKRLNEDTEKVVEQYKSLF